MMSAHRQQVTIVRKSESSGRKGAKEEEEKSTRETNSNRSIKTGWIRERRSIMDFCMDETQRHREKERGGDDVEIPTFEEVQGKEEEERVLNDLIHSDDDTSRV
jgi:hypothetical protein